MFAKHPDKMPPEPTPERVFALCRWALSAPSSRKDLESNLTIDWVFGDNPGIFSITLKCTAELGFVAERDGLIHVVAPESIFQSYESFRKHTAQIVFQKNETTFFKFSEWYLAQNEKIFRLSKWENVAAEADSNGINTVENDMFGWRWWASFLGLGYLHGTILISNLTVRIQDCLSNDKLNLPKNERIPAATFVKWLDNTCPEVKSSNSNQTLGLGASNGLRVLEKKGVLTFSAQADAERWKLYPIEGIQINEFSHVIIKG